VYAAHHQYEVACHNWQSVIEGGCKLLSRPGFRQFKALCNNDQSLRRDEHHLYKEWEKVFKARPKCISIMSGLITKDEEQEVTDKENHVNDRLDNDCSRAFFLAYQQLMVYLCSEEAALFRGLR
jgi:hypothetical protein